jgi:hypothetical protein
MHSHITSKLQMWLSIFFQTRHYFARDEASNDIFLESQRISLSCPHAIEIQDAVIDTVE